MDIREYIESGAIEAYVLGLSTAAETAEIEQLRKQYPELNNAIIAFEEQLERTAMTEAEAPPSFIKQELNEKLFGERKRSSGNMVTMERQMVNPFWKYVAAASIILLIVSAALNFYMYDQYKTADTAYRQLADQQNVLQADNKIMNAKLDEMNESMKIMTDPAMLPVSLVTDETPKKGEKFRTTVYWDTKTKDVYLLSNNLPKAPAGKQYQLWALVDGQPVDAGMIHDDCTGVCSMKNIPKAQAFAITLEKAGGSPSPDLDQLYVLGKI